MTGNWGKVVGALIGFGVGRWLGLVVGLLIGHWVDQNLGHWMGFGARAAAQRFFDSLFMTLGHLAKVDGRVSEAEIAATEGVMAQLRLTPEQRARARTMFRRGKSGELTLEEMLHRFRSASFGRPDLRRMFIEVLLALAEADGRVNEAEQQVLVRACRVLGIDPSELAGMRYRQRAGREAMREDPYQVLGVDKSASEAEIKRAYRRLMSRYHPDKLLHKGLPPEAAETAKQRVRTVRAAYDRIRELRGFR